MSRGSMTEIANGELRKLWARSEQPVLVDGVKKFLNSENVLETLENMPVAPHYGFYLKRFIEQSGIFPGEVDWSDDKTYNILAHIYEASRGKKLNLKKDVPDLREVIAAGYPLQRKSLFNWAVALRMDLKEVLKMLNAYDGRSIDAHDPRELLSWYCLALGSQDRSYTLAKFESMLAEYDMRVKALEEAAAAESGSSEVGAAANAAAGAEAGEEAGEAAGKAAGEAAGKAAGKAAGTTNETYTRLAEGKVEEIIRMEPGVRDEEMIRFMVDNCDMLYKVKNMKGKYYSITYASGLITLMKYAYLVWNRLELNGDDAELPTIEVVKDDEGRPDIIPVWFKGFLGELPSFLGYDEEMDALSYEFDQDEFKKLTDSGEKEQALVTRARNEALREATKYGLVGKYMARVKEIGNHIEAVYRRCKESVNTDPVSRNDVLFVSAILLLGISAYIRDNGADMYEDELLAELERRTRESDVQDIELTLAELLGDEDLAYWLENPDEHTPQARFILLKRYFDNILEEFNMFEIYPPHICDRAILRGFLVDDPLESGLETVYGMSELL